MSHQSGIVANPDLRSIFAQSKEENLRLVKVCIEDEQLVCASTKTSSSDWRTDYNTLVEPLLEPKQPCYIFYRLDEQNEQGYRWVFICYTPDHAPVRQKMLYASTRATCKMEFGAGNIKEELLGTTVEDVSLTAYDKHLIAQDAPAPLTMAEEELEEIKRTEVRADIGVDTKRQTMTSVTFPIKEDAQLSLIKLQDNELNYVQLAVDIKKEEIYQTLAESVDIGSLASRIPGDQGRYNIYRYQHDHEGTFYDTIIFIYTMPSSKCSVKERMLYSSCKAALLDYVEQNLQIELHRKMETDDPSELTQQFIVDEIHPKKDIVRQKFARPKGPASRGPKRMTKVTQE